MTPESLIEAGVDSTAIEASKIMKLEFHKNRASIGFAIIKNDLLDHETFKFITYAPAVKTLIWFMAKIRYEKKRSKDKHKERKIINNGYISFTYREAKLRGLSNQQFSKSLKILHALGFIDITKHGSGLMGDYSCYALSNRWKKYGKPDFERKEFPVNRITVYRRKAVNANILN